VLRAALTAVSAGVLVVYFVLVLLQVFFRYVLNESLYWAEEFVRGGLVWGVMLSSALVAGAHGHIRIEVLELMLPPAGRRIVVWAANSLTLAFLVLLVWAGIELVDRTWFQRSALLGVPKWSVYLAIPVGAALETLFTLAAWNDGHADQPTDPTL
jgi:TRAP-type C4-dicarboxylate transport system permease small subunit